MNKYAAKLLFQFRVVIDGKSSKPRTCEERIIVLSARSAKQALLKAIAVALKANSTTGIATATLSILSSSVSLDLLELGVECDSETVWYDIVTRVMPSERKKKIIPPESKLNAIAWESQSIRRTKSNSAWTARVYSMVFESPGASCACLE